MKRFEMFFVRVWYSMIMWERAYSINNIEHEYYLFSSIENFLNFDDDTLQNFMACEYNFLMTW